MACSSTQKIKPQSRKKHCNEKDKDTSLSLSLSLSLSPTLQFLLSFFSPVVVPPSSTAPHFSSYSPNFAGQSANQNKPHEPREERASHGSMLWLSLCTTKRIILYPLQGSVFRQVLKPFFPLFLHLSENSPQNKTWVITLFL